MTTRLSYLIDRDESISRLEDMFIPDDSAFDVRYNDGIDICIKEIYDMPIASNIAGKWIKASGYATPGGDPVWKCSECGKGLHAYGIETPKNEVSEHQWVACPNCGAMMTGGA